LWKFWRQHEHSWTKFQGCWAYDEKTPRLHNFIYIHIFYVCWMYMFVNGMWLFVFRFPFLWQIKIDCWGGVLNVATPLWAKCDDETHSRKWGLGVLWDSQKLKVRLQGQNTSHWSVLYINGKALKCRCPKWPRMIHLDICNPSYGQKKGRESN